MRIRFVEFIAIIFLAVGSCHGQGIISTVAGNVNSASCSSNSSEPALSTCMEPSGLAMDKQGNVYIADNTYFVVRKMDKAGNITTVAGSTFGYSGDGGPATSAQLLLTAGSPTLAGLALDSAGNLYISDEHNCAIRKVTAATGIITTVAGTGPNSCGYEKDGVPAKSTSLFYP
jgi:hypothetical protein